MVTWNELNQFSAKDYSQENIVGFIEETQPEVNVSCCPNGLGQNETGIEYSKINENLKVFKW